MTILGGFPVRPTRAAFGPTRVNEGVPVDLTKYVTAENFNLDHWQVAGCGLVVPRAWCLLSSAGAILAAAEAWDPDSASAPTPTKGSAGIYTLTYDATYPNKDGVQQATNLLFGLVAVQALGGDWVGVAVPQAANGRIVDIQLKTAGTLTDAQHAVFLW